MASLSLEAIRKSFGDTHILQGIDLDVEDGELVVLVGPSGCGKSTLLRVIAGLESPSAGRVRIGGDDVTPLPPKDRDVAMVFQSYALYPHLSVRDNLGFGLALRKESPAVIDERVREVSAMLGLDPLLGRLPRQLSGGQRQRVAMGRAIARRPRLFLFDEPLSNLDAALRTEVRVEIKKLHRQLAATMVYVTHDQVEAMTLADRLVILNGGVIEQVGPPLEVYGTPASRFVGTFMGSPAMNVLKAEAAHGRVATRDLDVPVDLRLEGDVLVGIRPHDVEVREGGGIQLKVEVVEAMGFETYAHGTVGGETFVARLEDTLPSPGDVIPLGIAPERVHLFDHVSEMTLR